MKRSLIINPEKGLKQYNHIISNQHFTGSDSRTKRRGEKRANFHINSNASAGESFRYLFKYKKAISEAITASESYRQQYILKDHWEETGVDCSAFAAVVTWLYDPKVRTQNKHSQLIIKESICRCTFFVQPFIVRVNSKNLCIPDIFFNQNVSLFP